MGPIKACWSRGGFSRDRGDRGEAGLLPHPTWDADELLGALFDVYDELPGDVKSALPLKRVWALVPDD
jgi:predicted Mrr-cat superfamily restriction endonuclease